MARLVARHGFRKLPNAFATHPRWRWSRRPALPRLFEGNPIAPLVASRSRIERRALTWPDHRGKSSERLSGQGEPGYACERNAAEYLQARKKLVFRDFGGDGWLS